MQDRNDETRVRKDKREHKRFETKTHGDGTSAFLLARYFPLAEANRGNATAEVLNISMGGIALLLDAKLTEGSKVEVVLPRYDDMSDFQLGYRFLAEVRWAREEEFEASQGRHGGDGKDVDRPLKKYRHGLRFLPISMVEQRNMRGLKALLDRFSGNV